MGIFYALLIGIFIGTLAKWTLLGKDVSTAVAALLGAVGSMWVFVIVSAVGWTHHAGNGPIIFASTVGALVLLSGHRLVATVRGA
jgi:uncharacterized membrane protein YeaQ/YmgE (transglycosylase-associated protein family)